MNEKAMKWPLLSPKDYNAVFDALSQKHPKLFMKEKVFIFKKGVHKDIFNTDDELKFSKVVIRKKFLKLYTRKKEYIEHYINNAPRYDLYGNKIREVTKEDVELFAKTQEEIKKQVALKKSKKFEQKREN